MKYLPPNTFIGCDAIKWAVLNCESETEAAAEVLFKSLQTNGLIRHASGDESKEFKRGFYFYCIVDEESKKYFEKYKMDSSTFERDWMEVGVVNQFNLKQYDNFYEDSSEIISNKTEGFPSFI